MNQSLPTASPTPAVPATPKSSWIDWGMLLLFVLVVAGPLVIYSMKGERVRWKIAQAQDYILSDEPEKALSVLEAIDLTQLGEQPENLISIADALTELGRYEAANKICDRVIQGGFMKEASPRLIRRFTDVQSNCLNYLGRNLDALALVKRRYELIPASPGQRSYRMNHLSYQRALAGVELGIARRAMQEVLETRHVGSEKLQPFWDLPYNSRAAVAAGILSMQLESDLDSGSDSISRPQDRALALLNSTIKRDYEELERKSDAILETAYSKMKRQIPFPQDAEKKLVELREQERAISKSLAMLLVVRSLVYDRQGAEALRQTSLKELALLGYNPVELAEQLPDKFTCMNVVDETAAFSDTIGLVYLRQFDKPSALRQLNLAVICAEYAYRAYSSPIQNRIENYYQDSRERMKRQRRRLAVIYSHRRDLFRMAGEKRLAELDRQRIESLGFSEGDVLF